MAAAAAPAWWRAQPWVARQVKVAQAAAQLRRAPVQQGRQELRTQAAGRGVQAAQAGPLAQRPAQRARLLLDRHRAPEQQALRLWRQRHAGGTQVVQQQQRLALASRRIQLAQQHGSLVRRQARRKPQHCAASGRWRRVQLEGLDQRGRCRTQLGGKVRIGGRLATQGRYQSVDDMSAIAGAGGIIRRGGIDGGLLLLLWRPLRARAGLFVQRHRSCARRCRSTILLIEAFKVTISDASWLAFRRLIAGTGFNLDGASERSGQFQ